MASSDDCFTKLNKKCTILDELRQITRETDWKKAAESDLQTFIFADVPRSLVERDEVLKVYSMYNILPKIFYMPEWTYYSLHKDSNRFAAINMALDVTDSASFFAASRFRPNQFNVVELQYEPGEYYVFNTQVKHGVYNRGQDRFVVSIGLGPSVSYLDALRIAEENGFLDR